MNNETRNYVKSLIRKHIGTLPRNSHDWWNTHRAGAHFIMCELCEALDLYTDDTPEEEEAP